MSYRVREAVEAYVAQFPTNTTIHLDGISSEEIGRLVLLDGRVKLQEKQGNDYKDVTSTKPGQRASHILNEPSESFVKALQYHVTQREEAEFHRYKTMGRGIDNTHSSMSENYWKGIYVPYDKSDPVQHGPLLAAFADKSGVHLIEGAISTGLSDTPVNPHELDRIRTRVFRYTLETSLERELEEISRREEIKQAVYDGITDAIDNRVDCRQLRVYQQLRVLPRKLLAVDITQNGNGYDVWAVAMIGTSAVTPRGQFITDGKYWMNILHDLKVIPIIGLGSDSVDFKKVIGPEQDRSIRGNPIKVVYTGHVSRKETE